MKSKKLIRSLLIVGMAILIACSVVWCRATKRYSGDSVLIYIPRTATVLSLSDSVCASLGQSLGHDVMSLWNHLPGKPTIKAGAYLINDGDRAIDIAKRIRNGRQTPVKFTFNNLRTLDQLADWVDMQMDMSADEFLAATDSILSARGLKSEQFPSCFLPDTYEAYWAETPDRFINRMLAYYDKFWTPERQAKARRLNLSQTEVATLASIVEGETSKLDERPKVARLYLNRLATGMRLQADPTVKFAIGDFALRRITREMLSTPSPYNTYINKGLPPGPINLPDKRTLDAVLDAPSHNYIYMCAKEDFSGYHNFSTDYATHQANGRRYRAALDARNIH